MLKNFYSGVRYEIIVFLCFTSITLGFLIGSNSYWVYLDNSFFTSSIYSNSAWQNNLFVFNNTETAFGVDKSLHPSFRIINTIVIYIGEYIPFGIGQFTVFTSILLFYYLSARAFLKEINSTSYRLLALFFTFNPVALYLLNQSAHALAYASLPLILYSLLKIAKSRSINPGHILLLVIGINVLLSYPRITLVYGVVISFATLIFVLQKYKTIHNFFQRLTVVVLLVILCNLFVISNLFHLIFVDSTYTTGPGEYINNVADSYGPIAYRLNEKRPISDSVVLNEITENYNNGTYESTAYKVIPVVIFFWLLFVTCSLSKVEFRLYKYYLVSGWGMFFVSTFILLLGRFVNQSTFVNFTYHIFPAFQNNTSWIYLILVWFYILILSVALKKFKGIIPRLLVVCYLLSGIIPLMFYNYSPELKTISKNDIPAVSSDEFFGSDDTLTKEASLHFPDSQLIFDWSRYPINVGNYSTKYDLFGSNLRLVKGDQAALSDQLYSSENFNNYSIFNLKNVYIHKNISNNNYNFPYFENRDYVTESNLLLTDFRDNKYGLSLVDDNSQFTKYKVQDSEKSDFLLYTPSSIETHTVESFDSEDLNINNKPLILSSNSFNRPIDVIDLDSVQERAVVHYKKADNDAPAYFVRIQNPDLNQPLFVHLNQSYSPNWTVVVIGEKYFDSINCANDYTYFEITENEFCYYDYRLFNLSLIKQYFSNAVVHDENHFEGNFIGNTWIVRPGEYVSGNQDMYLAIVYKKQIYFEITLFVSILVFLFLSALFIYQRLKLYTVK